MNINCFSYRVLKSNNEIFSPLILEDKILAKPNPTRKIYTKNSVQSILKIFFLPLYIIHLF